jgi:hypothetical protein
MPSHFLKMLSFMIFIVLAYSSATHQEEAGPEKDSNEKPKPGTKHNILWTMGALSDTIAHTIFENLGPVWVEPGSASKHAISAFNELTKHGNEIIDTSMLAKHSTALSQTGSLVKAGLVQPVVALAEILYFVSQGDYEEAVIASAAATTGMIATATCGPLCGSGANIATRWALKSQMNEAGKSASDSDGK